MLSRSWFAGAEGIGSPSSQSGEAGQASGTLSAVPSKPGKARRFMASWIPGRKSITLP